MHPSSRVVTVCDVALDPQHCMDDVHNVVFLQFCDKMAHLSPFFNFTNAIIVNHYLSLWFPVQSSHTTAASRVGI